jgi:uncharacterized protein (TIGR02271 family)
MQEQARPMSAESSFAAKCCVRSSREWRKARFACVKILSQKTRRSLFQLQEEVVVERVAAGEAQPLSGAIGDESEIRVPVSEERVSVVKEPVVTGEVRVRKQAVQDNQQVTDTVRHEEVRVENEGAVDVKEKSTSKTGRKKPAA